MPRPSRRRLLRHALTFLLLIAAVSALAQLAGVTGSGRPRSATKLVFEDTHEQWLVKLPKGAARASVGKAAGSLGGGRVGPQLPGGWREVDLSGEAAAADAEAAFARAGAIDVEPVLPRTTYDETVPAPDGITDGEVVGDATSHEPRVGALRATRLAEQWALQQPNDHDIDGVEAWSAATGSGALVAVIDTGVDASHPDLVGRVLEGRDFAGSTTPATHDAIGHGTAVASIVAGAGIGMAGVAPEARILPLKVFRNSEYGFSMSGYLSALRYAVDQGADVINISLGCGGTDACFSQAELDALSYANDHGVLVVVAAGNGDRTGNGMDNDAPETPDFPSSYELPNIISVNSVGRLGTWSSWSNFGATTVDVAAPGESILAAAPGGGYATRSGTSFSAPHVSGVGALVAAANPGASVVDVRARVLGAATRDPSLTGRNATGGMLNAEASLSSQALGGGGTEPKLVAPATGKRLVAPPVLSWVLPAGWRSVAVQLRNGAARYDASVPAARRSLAHPAAAWRAGTYSWRVVARAPNGRTVTTPTRTYRIVPRLGAWVTSGRIRSNGRRIRLRVGYAANVPRARTQVTIRLGRRVIHRGRASFRSVHANGRGTPRRGWFVYDARSSVSLRPGQRVSVEVRIDGGGSRLVRRFTARVA